MIDPTEIDFSFERCLDFALKEGQTYPKHFYRSTGTFFKNGQCYVKLVYVKTIHGPDEDDWDPEVYTPIALPVAKPVEIARVKIPETDVEREIFFK